MRGQFGIRHGGERDAQIDAIEQRAGESRAVTRQLCARAATATPRIARMSAWTRIHRRDQLECGRVFGARTDAQLADNLKAADLRLTAEEAARLEQVSRPPLLYPYWHQQDTAADRLSPADLVLIGSHLA